MVTLSPSHAMTRAPWMSLTRSGAYYLTVAVNYATAGGTATSGTDFIASQGTLVFPPGTTTRSVSVPVLGDFVSEGSETFVVNLSNPVNATIATPQGTGTSRSRSLEAALPTPSSR